MARHTGDRSLNHRYVRHRRIRIDRSRPAKRDDVLDGKMCRATETIAYRLHHGAKLGMDERKIERFQPGGAGPHRQQRSDRRPHSANRLSASYFHDHCLAPPSFLGRRRMASTMLARPCWRVPVSAEGYGLVLRLPCLRLMLTQRSQADASIVNFPGQRATRVILVV